MNSWRDRIVRKLEAAPGRIVLVADPDDLLLEEQMLQRIEELGFDLLTFEDHVAFRFAFESRNESSVESGGEALQRILIRLSASETDVLPHDLLVTGHRLSFGLSRLFPRLSYPVVASLDRAHLDALFAAQRLHPPAQSLGDQETREYVLRHVFGVAPETIASEEDLLRFLLRRHYRQLRIPAAFDAQLAKSLSRSRRFREWPLASIIPDREGDYKDNLTRAWNPVNLHIR